MDILDFRNYCMKLKGVEETLPFDEDTLVFKVMGKMFALTSISKFERINLKCDPELAIELREQYEAVQPGYHMSKKHWNSVYINGSIPDHLVKKWVVNSYDLVISRFTKKMKLEYDSLDELKQL